MAYCNFIKIIPVIYLPYLNKNNLYIQLTTLEKIQKLGFAAKGLVYFIIGALTALAAVEMGGEKAGRSDVINFLQKQPFGKFILLVVAIGIFAYAIWRFYTVIADPDNEGDEASGILKRFGYFISSLVYLLFGVTILMTTFGIGSGGGSQQYYLAQLMQKSYGPYIIGLAGIILIGVGIYQIYKGYSGKYREDLDSFLSGQEKTVSKIGKYGYMARGIVFGIIGWVVFNAAINQNTATVQGIQGAFSFLEQLSYGTFLMGIVAVGLMGYGIFMFLVAKNIKA